MLIDSNLISIENKKPSTTEVAGSAVPLTSLRRPGGAEAIPVCVRVLGSLAGITSLTIVIKEADKNSTAAGDWSVASTQTYTAAQIASNGQIPMRYLPAGVSKKWIKFCITMAGTCASDTKLFAAVVREDYQPYVSGLYIDKGQTVG